MQSIPMIEMGPSSSAIAAEAEQVADVVSDTRRKRRELRLPLEFVKPLWMLLDACTRFGVTAMSLSPDLFPGSTAYEHDSPSLIFGMLLGSCCAKEAGAMILLR